MRTFTGQEFEDEVRQICRNLFSNSVGQGCDIIDGKERDGVFFNGDFYTYVEATTDKKKSKAEYDGKKTHDLVTKKRSEGHMAKGYLVTLHEPTADQREALRKYERTTKIISFDELRSLLFDAAGYLRTRASRPFGSVYDHVSESFSVPREDFVAPTINRFPSGISVDVQEVVSAAMNSERMIITAEYGIGKSMLLREIFFLLAKQYAQKNIIRFPVAINLRDHMGQTDPVELLERHARNYAVDPRKLVAAWSAGHVDLIIDGFDELSTRGWTGDHRKLREFKRSTHAVVKKLIRQTPKKCSVIIAGRAAYFDSDKEMREALGTSLPVFQHLLVQPFDTDQATEFLKKKGYDNSLPQWLPTRPLFLSYLINKNLLGDAVSVSSIGGYPEGTAWSALLDMIAERESEQQEGVDKESILQFWGLLATKARQDSTLQKSFSPTEMDEVFYRATGNTVSEDERRLLLRLPGLGVSSDNASNRTFVDIDFLNAASANLVYSHIFNPYGDEQYRDDLRDVVQQLNQVGSYVICAKCESESLSVGKISACMHRELGSKNYALAYDVFYPFALMGQPEGYLSFEGLDINEIDVCMDCWENVKVDFSNCIIANLILPPDGDLPSGLHFTECLVGNIEGRASTKDLPDNCFIGCEVHKFSDSFGVNNGVLDSNLPIGVRVLVVTLRKVFVQSGISRLESALLRGLDHRARMIAPVVIELLKKYKFVVESGRQGKTIYSGTRSKRKEALSIIQAPALYVSGIIDECRKLS